MLSEEELEEIIDLLLKYPQSKVYYGCDSLRYQKINTETGKKEWWAKYATVLIIHKDGKRGCRIFRNISHDKDFDIVKNRPSQRLMNEVFKIGQMWSETKEIISGFPVEIHLDINRDTKHGSSCVAKQAAGYIHGLTQIEPHLKPEAFASSFGADGIGRGFHERSNK